MRIEVTQWKVENERKLWVFSYNGHSFCLWSYHEQTRVSKRHKWTGPFWDHNDERHYHSKLPRPITIPDRVLMDARDQVKQQIDEADIYIGWLNPDHKIT